MGFFNWFEKAIDTCQTACDNLVNGSKYREEARHYREFGKRLEQDYAKLLEKYREFEKGAKEEINAYAYELTRKTWECERLRLVVDLQKEVIALLELVDRTVPKEVCQQLSETVYYTNLVLKELGIEPIEVRLIEERSNLSGFGAEIQPFVLSPEPNKIDENYVVLDKNLLQNLSGNILKKWTAK